MKKNNLHLCISIALIATFLLAACAPAAAAPTVAPTAAFNPRTIRTRAAPTDLPTPTDIPTNTPTPAPTATITSTPMPVLTIKGKVKTQLSFTLNDLEKMTQVKETVTFPDYGVNDVQGVSLNALLALAGVDPLASSVVLTASDDYSAEAKLPLLRGCQDKCVVVPNSNGGVDSVMPHLSGLLWMMNVVTIEVK